MGWRTFIGLAAILLVAGCGRAITAREARAQLDPAQAVVPSTPSSLSLVDLALEAASLPEPRRQIVEAALAHAGMPATGVDCSQLTTRVYAATGIDLPRTAEQQMAQGRPVEAASLMPGDLVFFAFRHRPADHVGIFTGQGAFVHVSSASSNVRLDRLTQDAFAGAYVGARSYVR